MLGVFYFMCMKLKSIGILLGIIVVLLLFYSPLGNSGKILLTKILAPTPKILEQPQQYAISTYDWRLKDKDWNFFSFEKAKGSTTFVTFWASWHLPSKAALESIQDLYHAFEGQISFYIITNEERAPVETFMANNGYAFPVTYRVVGEPTPFKNSDFGASYLIGPNGNVWAETFKTARWNDEALIERLKGLIQTKP